jgi:hypothetical protein
MKHAVVILSLIALVPTLAAGASAWMSRSLSYQGPITAPCFASLSPVSDGLVISQRNFQTTQGRTLPYSYIHSATTKLNSDSHTNSDTTDWTRIESALQQTWNWCANFVVPLSLCPWASNSVRAAERAIQFYVADSAVDQSMATDTLLELSRRLRDQLETGQVDPNNAILFQVFVNSDHQPQDPWFARFEPFHEWFVQTEDDWLDLAADNDQHHVANACTLASFHPDWMYQGQESDALQLEKQSPFPIVSVVATSVIDKAGATVTEVIAEHNAETFARQSLGEWKEFYRQAIAGNQPINLDFSKKNDSCQDYNLSGSNMSFYSANP